MKAFLKSLFRRKYYKFVIYQYGGGVKVNGIPLGEREIIYSKGNFTSREKARRLAQETFFDYDHRFPWAYTYEVMEDNSL